MLGTEPQSSVRVSMLLTSEPALKLLLVFITLVHVLMLLSLRSEDKLLELVLSIHSVSPREQTGQIWQQAPWEVAELAESSMHEV